MTRITGKRLGIIILVAFLLVVSIYFIARPKEELYRIPKPALEEGSTYAYQGELGGKTKVPEGTRDFSIKVDLEYECLGTDEGRPLLRETRIEKIPPLYAASYGDAEEIRSVNLIKLTSELEVFATKLESIEPESYAQEKGPLGIWRASEHDVLPLYQDFPYSELYGRGFPLGKEWKIELSEEETTPTSIINYQGEEIAKLEGIEKVETRAGTFECFKLTTIKNLTGKAVLYGETETMYIYQKTLGWVDQETGVVIKKLSEYKMETVEGFNSFSYSVELADYGQDGRGASRPYEEEGIVSEDYSYP
jgi:hypothetical protein